MSLWYLAQIYTYKLLYGAIITQTLKGHIRCTHQSPRANDSMFARQRSFPHGNENMRISRAAPVQRTGQEPWQRRYKHFFGTTAAIGGLDCNLTSVLSRVDLAPFMKQWKMKLREVTALDALKETAVKNRISKEIYISVYTPLSGLSH